jgi:hypothetical protein
MTSIRCSVCANPVAKRIINDHLREGMSAAGISRYLEAIGATVTADVISRHRKHWNEGEPEKPKGTSKRDFAIIVQERAVEQFEDGELDLANKDHAAGIKAGLQAQAILDRREAVKGKNAFAELGRGLLAMMLGEAMPAPAPALDDGLTVEGEFSEVGDGEAE